jgi:hypothetical protein
MLIIYIYKIKMTDVFLKCRLENGTYNCVVLNEGTSISLKNLNNASELNEFFDFNVPDGDYIGHLLFKDDGELMTVYSKEYDDLNMNFTINGNNIYDIEGNEYNLVENTNRLEGENYNLIYYGLNFFEIYDKINNKTYAIQFIPNNNIKSIINNKIEKKLYEINEDSMFWWTGKGVNLISNALSTDEPLPEEEDKVTMEAIEYIYSSSEIKDLLKSYFNSEDINPQMLIVWLLNNMYITELDTTVSRKGLQELKRIGEEENINFNEIPDDINILEDKEVTENDFYIILSELLKDDADLLKNNKVLNNYMFSEYSLLLKLIHTGLEMKIIKNKNVADTTIKSSNSKITVRKGRSSILSFDFNLNNKVKNTKNKILLQSNNYYYIKYYEKEYHFYIQM